MSGKITAQKHFALILDVMQSSNIPNLMLSAVADNNEYGSFSASMPALGLIGR